jgi:hypothetical protein
VTAAEAGTAAVVLDHVWVGAGIHIHTGGPAAAREPFLPWRDLPDDPDAVFALLSWHARLAPLTGREKDEETLLMGAAGAEHPHSSADRLRRCRQEPARGGGRRGAAR